MATRPLDVDRSATVLTPAATSRGEWPVYVGVGASSAAVIVFEIVLTRIFAVSQFYHFAFMTVSLALLGFGASGTALAVFPGWVGGDRGGGQPSPSPKPSPPWAHIS